MNKELLIEGIKKLGMETTEEQIERFTGLDSWHRAGADGVSTH